jgi:hypothetical protein
VKRYTKCASARDEDVVPKRLPGRAGARTKRLWIFVARYPFVALLVDTVRRHENHSAVRRTSAESTGARVDNAVARFTVDFAVILVVGLVPPLARRTGIVPNVLCEIGSNCPVPAPDPTTTQSYSSLI